MGLLMVQPRPAKERWDSTRFQTLLMASVNEHNERRRAVALPPRFIKTDGTISLKAIAKAVVEVLPDAPMADGTLYAPWHGNSQPEPATLEKLARLFGHDEVRWLEAGGHRTPRTDEDAMVVTDPELMQLLRLVEVKAPTRGGKVEVRELIERTYCPGANGNTTHGCDCP